MKARYLISGLLALLLAYLLFYPVPIEPAAWTPPLNPGMSGPYAPDAFLDEVDYRFPGQCLECEDIAIDSLGRIYGGSSEGEIIRFDGDKREVFAHTGGRPLGLHFDAAGSLIVADSEKGLLSVDPSGKVAVLATEFGGLPFGITDDLEVAPDGVIYFSDASWKFPFGGYKLDLMEHRPNGRLLAYYPNTGKVELLLDSLYFANGIAVDPGNRFVLVNETGAYRTQKYWLAGPKKGQSEMFIQNLPGFPDGISAGTGGIYWLAIISRRNSLLDWIMPRPFVRKVILRLPEFFQPAPERFAFVLGLNEQGEVVYNLQGPSGKYAQVTSVQEFDGKLYLGSLLENGVGVVGRP